MSYVTQVKGILPNRLCFICIGASLHVTVLKLRKKTRVLAVSTLLSFRCNGNAYQPKYCSTLSTQKVNDRHRKYSAITFRSQVKVSDRRADGRPAAAAQIRAVALFAFSSPRKKCFLFNVFDLKSAELEFGKTNTMRQSSVFSSSLYLH